METNQFSNPAGVLGAISRALQHILPPKEMLPSEWAEANVRISLGNAIPGPLRFNNSPFQRGMLDVIKEPGCRRVTYQTGAQVGKTTVIQCVIGYHIAHDPKSMIVLQPSQGDMATFLSTKLHPMINENPVLANTVAKPRGRDGQNNSRMISYPGGWVMLSWAGSPKTLRGRSAPVLLADEVDGYSALTEEGSPIELLAQRSASFGDQRLLIESSTPTIKGTSQIEKSFLAGDQRRFWIPCPDCGTHHVMKWENVRWEGMDAPEGEQLPETARYCCPHCGSLWDDGQRIEAIRSGEWRAEKPFRGHASFQISEMYSTFRRLRDIVQSFLDKAAAGDAQSFINISLGESYEESGEKADPASLMNRRETYRAQVPMDACYLTAGCDMQQDRLEVEVVAWGLGEQSWSIGYHVLWGDPLQGDVFDDLDDLLAETYKHESGAEMTIAAACLDTGGTSGYTQKAYEYARGRTGRRLFAIKGVGGWGRAIVEKPQRKQSGKHTRKVDLFLVGVDEAKLVTMRRLALSQPGPGYCHFPDDRDEEYFKQLTAEKLVTRYVKGFPVREWHKPDRARNEALDCRVYALSALKIMNPSLKRLNARLNPGTKAESFTQEDEVQHAQDKTEEKTDKNMRKTAPQHLKKYLEYLKNAGGSVPMKAFFDDFDPVGGQVLGQMVAAQLVEIGADGCIVSRETAPETQNVSREATQEKLPEESKPAEQHTNAIKRTRNAARQRAGGGFVRRY